jgi:hypothetical protein
VSATDRDGGIVWSKSRTGMSVILISDVEVMTGQPMA